MNLKDLMRQVIEQRERYAEANGLSREDVIDLRSLLAGEMAEVQTTKPIRPLTQQLIECCREDVWPGRAAVIDFGLDSSSHLGALQYAIREELVTPEELDAAMGNGQKLTEIAQRGENPYRFVTFRTVWDNIPREPDIVEPEWEMER